MKSQRRVLMLVSNDFAPDPRVDKEARSLARHGWDVTILAMRRRATSLPEDTRDGALRVVRFDVGQVKTGAVFDVSYRLSVFARRVRQWLRNNPGSWDIVHAHDLDTLRLGTACKRVLGARLLYDAHEFFPGYTARAWLNRALSVNESLLIRNVDGFLQAGPLRAAMFVAAHPSAAGRPMTYLQNLPPRSPDFTKSVADHIRIQYQGVLNPDRCIGEICEALALLPHSDRARFRLEFYGQPTAYSAKVEQRLPELGLAGQVAFRGFLPSDQLALATRDVDVGLVALRGQSLNATYPEPNKLYDYLAAKALVIAQDVPGIRDLVRQRELGFLCDFQDPRSIRDALLQLTTLTDRSRRQERAYELHSQEFNWERQEHLLLELYERLCR